MVLMESLDNETRSLKTMLASKMRQLRENMLVENP